MSDASDINRQRQNDSLRIDDSFETFLPSPGADKS
jgi:hypothetical protein